MRPTSKKGASYADIEALPEHLTGELFGDELFVSPRPSPFHATVATRLARVVGALEEDSGDEGVDRWRILVEPELHLSGDVMVPDLAAWRWARMPVVPKKAFIDIVPDWVCEIASPATARVDRAYKLPRYAKAGVGHAWIIDPVMRSIDALRLQNGLWALIGCFVDEERVSIEPFSSLEFDMSKLWAEELPSVHERGPRYG